MKRLNTWYHLPQVDQYIPHDALSSSCRMHGAIYIWTPNSFSRASSTEEMETEMQDDDLAQEKCKSCRDWQILHFYRAINVFTSWSPSPTSSSWPSSRTQSYLYLPMSMIRRSSSKIRLVTHIALSKIGDIISIGFKPSSSREIDAGFILLSSYVLSSPSQPRLSMRWDDYRIECYRRDKGSLVYR